MKITLKQLRKLIDETFARLDEDVCPCGIERADCTYHADVQPAKKHEFIPGEGHVSDENPNMDLAVSTRVKVVYVDMFGFTGRDKHPAKSDLGRTGTIKGVAEDSRDPDHPFHDQVDDPLEHYVCYDVEMDDGKDLELMNFEISPSH